MDSNTNCWFIILTIFHWLLTRIFYTRLLPPLIDSGIAASKVFRMGTTFAPKMYTFNGCIQNNPFLLFPLLDQHFSTKIEKGCHVYSITYILFPQELCAVNSFIPSCVKTVFSLQITFYYAALFILQVSVPVPLFLFC